MTAPSYPAVLLSYLPLIPAALLCCFPMRNQRKVSFRSIALRAALLFLAAFPIAAWVDYRLSLAPNALLFPLLFLCFLVYQSCLRTHWSKSLAVFFYVCALMSMLSNLVHGIEAIRYPELGANSYSVENSLLQFAFAAAVAFLLYLPMTRYASQLIDRLDISSVWLVTIPISWLITGFNLIIRPLRYEALHLSYIFISFWAVLLTFLLLFGLLSVIFYILVTWLLSAAETETRNHILEMQESQYVSQQKYIEATASARHDFKQSIRTLKALAQAGDHAAITEYLAQYPESLPENDVVNYCRNRSVNALLNYYVREALNSGIKLNLQIDLPDRIPVSDVDLCNIAGNILDNAVAACQEVPEQSRWLQFSLTTRDDRFLYLVSTNSFSGRVKQKDGRYLSTHRSGNGIGLRSIQSIVERYGGSARFSHQDTEFYSDVMIPLISEENPSAPTSEETAGDA